MNEPFLLAYALLRQAEAMVSAQHFADAGSVAHEASELALTMGARPLLGEIEALIRSARLRAEGPSSPTPEVADSTVDDRFGLTAREREVLQLVSEGKRNNDIAQELWVSPSTVRKHLENIYAKLGVNTRTAAVRVLADRSPTSR